MKARLGTPKDIEGILALQKLNLYTELTEEERERGFVTTPFSAAKIEAIIKTNGVFVVVDKAKVIAYAYAGTWAYFSQWPIFPYMESRLPRLNFQGRAVTTDNTFQYGPVCIDLDYRGQKILNLIFETLRLEWRKQFPISITFINAINEISARAHKKLGWEIIDEFEFNGKQYLGLAIDMEQSVL